MYLFTFGCAGSPLLYGLFSSCGRRFFIAMTSLVAVACGLRACGLQQLQPMGSGAPAQQLWHTSLVLHSMWDLPEPGIEPCLLHWQVESPPLSHQGSPQRAFLQQDLKARIEDSKLIFYFLQYIKGQICRIQIIQFHNKHRRNDLFTYEQMSIANIYNYFILFCSVISNLPGLDNTLCLPLA